MMVCAYVTQMSAIHLFTPLPTLPLFFPHRLVFNMDAQNVLTRRCLRRKTYEHKHTLRVTGLGNTQYRSSDTMCEHKTFIFNEIASHFKSKA